MIAHINFDSWYFARLKLMYNIHLFSEAILFHLVSQKLIAYR